MYFPEFGWFCRSKASHNCVTTISWGNDVLFSKRDCSPCIQLLLEKRSPNLLEISYSQVPFFIEMASQTAEKAIKPLDVRWFVILLEILNHNSNSPPSQERLPIAHWEPAWAGSQQSSPAWFQLSLHHCLEWDDLKTITIRKPKWVANLEPWCELPRVSITVHSYTILRF